jgi:molybdopterin-binding protein
MPRYRLGTAARILGVSIDTVRRWADAGKLATVRTEGGQRLVDGAALAAFADALDPPGTGARASTARNRLDGIVTRVVRDRVAAQVEMRCGPFRLVALVTRDSVDALKLEAGSPACAVVKATNVVVEVPDADVEHDP